MQECKALEDDYMKYSEYIHGFWIPWLEQQRENKRLHSGKYDETILHLLV